MIVTIVLIKMAQTNFNCGKIFLPLLIDILAILHFTIWYFPKPFFRIYPAFGGIPGINLSVCRYLPKTLITSTTFYYRHLGLSFYYLIFTCLLFRKFEYTLQPVPARRQAFTSGYNFNYFDMIEYFFGAKRHGNVIYLNLNIPHE